MAWGNVERCPGTISANYYIELGILPFSPSFAKFESNKTFDWSIRSYVKSKYFLIWKKSGGTRLKMLLTL